MIVSSLACRIIAKAASVGMAGDYPYRLASFEPIASAEKFCAINS